MKTYWAIEDKKGKLRTYRFTGLPELFVDAMSADALCRKDERPVKVEIRKVEE